MSVEAHLWDAMQHPTGRRACFGVRPGVTETYNYTLHDWPITYTWDVVALQQRSNGRPIVMESVAPLAEEIDRGDAEVDRRRVLTDPAIDPGLPVLAVPLPWPPAPNGGTACIVADGWHRIARAWAMGLTEIPMVLLYPADEEACRLAPSLREIVGTVLRERAARAAGGNT